MSIFSSNIKFIYGIAVGVLIGSATVVFANQAINAILNEEIKISLNGVVQNFIDEKTGEKQYPITYLDRTYLPLRNVAQLAGMKVDYDNNTNTAILKSQEKEEKEEMNLDTIFADIIDYDKRTGNYISISKLWLDGEIIFACCGGEGSNHLEIFDANGKHLYSGNGDFGESDVYADEANKLYYYEYNTDGYEDIRDKIYLNYKDGKIIAKKDNSSTNNGSNNINNNGSNNTAPEKVESTSETIARFIKEYNKLNPDYMISEVSNSFGTAITFGKDGISIKVSYEKGKITAIVTENTWIIDGVRQDMFKQVPTRYKEVIYNLARVGNKDISKKVFDEIYDDLNEGKYASSLINNELELDGVYISYYNQKDFFSTTIEMEF